MRRAGIEELQEPARPGRVEEIPERRDYGRRGDRDTEMTRRGIGGFVDRLQSGAKSVMETAGPQVAAFRGETGAKDQSFMAKVGRHMRAGAANAEVMAGGGMDFGITPFAGGLPSAPGFGRGFGLPGAPRDQATRKKGGSRTTIHTGGKTITITSGGGKKRKRRGGGSTSVPPWHPDFRLPY
jgi:hypothetical protein